MSKILTVFGATGNQGGSVIRAILADPALSREFRIRGVTRDSSKPSAQALAAKGVELVQADMSSVQGAAPAVQGAHTVFLVTNFWESMSADVEVSQGRAVADASKQAGVKHIVFSALINTSEASGGRLSHISHFDGKARIEEYIRKSSGVPVTSVLPGFFMSNLLTQIRKGDDGAYAWTLPEGVSADGGKVPLFDVADDMGKFVKAAIKNFPSFAGKRIYAATDYYSPQRIVSELAAVCGGSDAAASAAARVQNVPQDVFKSFLPPAVAQEMLENMLLLEDPGYYGGADLSESLALLEEKPTTWRDFVAKNKDKFA